MDRPGKTADLPSRGSRDLRGPLLVVDHNVESQERPYTQLG